MSWEEHEKLQADALAARIEERNRALKPLRPQPGTGATRASAILAGLAAPPRPFVPKGEPDEFRRLEREVEKGGRPISGLARHFYEEEKARRDGESDAE